MKVTDTDERKARAKAAAQKAADRKVRENGGPVVRRSHRKKPDADEQPAPTWSGAEDAAALLERLL